jgi:hypothetical protein
MCVSVPVCLCVCVHVCVGSAPSCSVLASLESGRDRQDAQDAQDAPPSRLRRLLLDLGGETFSHLREILPRFPAQIPRPNYVY